jgi:hypothetical protein
MITGLFAGSNAAQSGFAQLTWQLSRVQHSLEVQGKAGARFQVSGFSENPAPQPMSGFSVLKNSGEKR